MFMLPSGQEATARRPCTPLFGIALYVALRITQWVHAWARRGWLTRVGEPVKNQDLWKALLSELRQYKHNGAQVKFWRILREHTSVADQAAKQAAKQAATQAESPYFWHDYWDL
jgi:ribonuclease HI